MQIGSGWTKTTKNKKTFISLSLDDAFLELVPVLKNTRLMLFYTDANERKSENSPGWEIVLAKKNAENKNTIAEVPDSPQQVTDEEIPF